MLPADVSFLEDIFHIVFIEIMPLDRYRAVCLRVVVDVMVGTVPFQFITGSIELFDRLLPWIHYVPPVIILYTKLGKKSMINTQRYTKAIEREVLTPLNPSNVISHNFC